MGLASLGLRTAEDWAREPAILTRISRIVGHSEGLSGSSSFGLSLSSLYGATSHHAGGTTVLQATLEPRPRLPVASFCCYPPLFREAFDTHFAIPSTSDLGDAVSNRIRCRGRGVTRHTARDSEAASTKLNTVTHPYYDGILTAHTPAIDHGQHSDRGGRCGLRKVNNLRPQRKITQSAPVTAKLLLQS